MTPKMMDSYSDFRKELILHASWDTFVELGYQRTTLREIAKRMNASTGTIYTYFENKEELIDALLVYNSEKSRESFGNLTEKYKGRDVFEALFATMFEQIPVKELSKIVRGSFDVWSRAMEKKKAREILSSSWVDLQESIEKIIKKGIKSGEFKRSLDSKTMAGFIVVVLLGLQVQIMLMGQSITSAYIDRIKKTTLKMLK